MTVIWKNTKEWNGKQHSGCFFVNHCCSLITTHHSPPFEKINFVLTVWFSSLFVVWISVVPSKQGKEPCVDASDVWRWTIAAYACGSTSSCHWLMSVVVNQHFLFGTQTRVPVQTAAYPFYCVGVWHVFHMGLSLQLCVFRSWYDVRNVLTYISVLFLALNLVIICLPRIFTCVLHCTQFPASHVL